MHEWALYNRLTAISLHLQQIIPTSPSEWFFSGHSASSGTECGPMKNWRKRRSQCLWISPIKHNRRMDLGWFLLYALIICGNYTKFLLLHLPLWRWKWLYSVWIYLSPLYTFEDHINFANVYTSFIAATCGLKKSSWISLRPNSENWKSWGTITQMIIAWHSSETCSRKNAKSSHHSPPSPPATSHPPSSSAICCWNQPHT